MADAKTYTEPELRERLKEQIKAGDKGGRPGQWSARKSQLLVHEYERAGGGYVDDGHLSNDQKHLKQWGEQDWHGASGDADSGGGRYLPDVAWELLTPAERRATDRKKKDGEQQHVANTAAAKQARDAAQLLTMTAPEAVKAVKALDGRSALERARTAEKDHGKARKTVLAAIDEALSQLD